MDEIGIKHFYIEFLEECEDAIASNREKYWIQEFDCCNCGYNISTGGLGRSLIAFDDDVVVETYKRSKNVSLVANEFGCDPTTVRKRLHAQGITPDVIHVDDLIQRRAKCGIPVDMLNLDGELIQRFDALNLAAIYLIEKGFSGSSANTTRTHISHACRNKRKTAYGYKWKYAA